MDMTTAERVRVMMMAGAVDAGTALHTDTSSALAQLIPEVSAAAETLMDRYADNTVSRTEYFDVEPGKTLYRVKGFPVATLTSVHYDPWTQAFASTTALTSGTDFFSVTLNPHGFIRMMSPFACESLMPSALKVVYTGGMAASAAAFITAYPDIAMAIEQQVIYQWKRRNDLGTISVSDAGGTVTTESMAWLPSVRAILEQHKRGQCN